MTSLYPRQARPRSPRRQPPARQPRTRAPRRDEPWASPRPGWTRVWRHHHPGPAAEFSRITRARLPVFCELIDLLQQSDVHIAACIVDLGNGTDPFAVDEPQWLAHALVTAKLLVGIINKRELAGVLLDQISTPRGCAFDDSARHGEHQDASNVAGVSGLRGLNEQRRRPTRRHRGGSRRLCMWSYGDSNPRPLACHQQAGRPPEYIRAGHRPEQCTGVRRCPPRLRYFRAVLLASRHALAAGCLSPLNSRCRDCAEPTWTCREVDLNAPHHGRTCAAARPRVAA